MSPIVLPSIRARLSRWLIVISVIGSLAVAATMWAITRHEVEEIMDNTLQESAEILYGLLLQHGATLPLDASKPGALAAPPHHETLIWQLVDSQQKVLLRSHFAPDTALLAAPAASQAGAKTAGPTNSPDSSDEDTRFTDAANGWRVIALPFRHSTDPHAARMLYVAQDRAERRDAHVEIASYTIGASLLVGLLCTLWLRARLRRELEPLAALSEAVRHYDPLADHTRLPPATRLELAPMQRAISGLAQRLAQRLRNERAFTAHAAHALRTPLAGMDTQLAVALRECPPAVQPRLERTREAVSRLRRVVTALLTLFRTGGEPQWEWLVLDDLMQHLPIEGLDVATDAVSKIHCDPDLLAAALLNLLDNAQRHGASQMVITCRSGAEGQVLTLRDNGCGIADEQRGRLQAALDAQNYAALSGLGLMLADLVARAHDGRLTLLKEASGCAVCLTLGHGPRNLKDSV